MEKHTDTPGNALRPYLFEAPRDVVNAFADLQRVMRNVDEKTGHISECESQPPPFAKWDDEDMSFVEFWYPFVVFGIGNGRHGRPIVLEQRGGADGVFFTYDADGEVLITAPANDPEPMHEAIRRGPRDVRHRPEWN